MNDIVNMKQLRVSFAGRHGRIEAVRGVDLAIAPGEIFALVGESGCGKSVTAQSILRLNPKPAAQVTAEALMLAGQDVLHASEKDMEHRRGNIAGMIFQDPMTCLNPTMKIGKQITERLYRKEHWSMAQCQQEAIRLLEMVHIPDARERVKQYPHQFSGGMRQRVMVAMAISGNPKLLIADEPTTALDAITQLQILKLLQEVRQSNQMAILLITHNLRVVVNMAERMAVMYAGRIVEEGSTTELFACAEHPYTKALLTTMPEDKDGASLQTPEWLPITMGTAGCSFINRCPHPMQICRRKEPPDFWIAPTHRVACWRWHDGFLKEQRHG